MWSTVHTTVHAPQEVTALAAWFPPPVGKGPPGGFPASEYYQVCNRSQLLVPVDLIIAVVAVASVAEGFDMQ